MAAAEYLAAGSQLIGGSGSGSSSTYLSPDQLPYLKDLFQRASEFSQRPTFVGFNPLQKAGQQAAINFAGGISPFISGAFGAGQNLFTAGNPLQNPYLQQTAGAAIRPLYENLMRDILPGINDQAIASGAYSGTGRDIERGLARAGTAQAAGDVLGNIFSNAYGQGLQAQQAGIGLAPQLAQLGLLPSGILQDIGGQQRALTQEGILDPFTQLERFQSLLGAPITLSKSKQESSTGLGGIGGVIGGAKDLLGGGGGLGGFALGPGFGLTSALGGL